MGFWDLEKRIDEIYSSRIRVSLALLRRSISVCSSYMDGLGFGLLLFLLLVVSL